MLSNCTFTGNRNAVDDMGGESVYANCVFIDNNLTDGLTGTERYELDLPAGGKVSGCFIKGVVHDHRQAVSTQENVLNAPPPRFSKYFAAESPEYKGAGYRPVSTEPVSTGIGR
jgi:hypothetical protein